jgi:CRISPR-associated protein (TIGR02584 family)
MNDKKTVLVVGMGTSPAVMTETVWALAHQSEPVVPDEIVVITTKSGKDALRAAIMSGAPSVWNRLKTALAKEKIAITSYQLKRILPTQAQLAKCYADAERQMAEKGALVTGEW